MENLLKKKEIEKFISQILDDNKLYLFYDLIEDQLFLASYNDAGMAAMKYSLIFGNYFIEFIGEF